MKNVNWEKSDNYLYAFLSASFFSFLFLLYTRNVPNQLKDTGVVTKILSSNIALYLIALCIFIVAFFSAYVLGDKISISTGRNMYRICERVVYIFACVFFIGAIYLEDRYTEVYQTYDTFRHTIWLPIYLAIVGVTVIFLAQSIIYNNSSIHLRLRITILLLFAVLIVVLTFCPNPLFNPSCLYHYDAYINSIVNTNRYVPYTYDVNSIYGHYAIFYIIPVKFLHLFTPTKWHAISLAIAITAGIAYFLFSYVLEKVIKKDIVFVLAILAIGMWSLGYAEGNYYQLYPHRVIFQAVCIFVLYILIENPESKLVKLLTVFIIMSGIVWNSEVGLVCAIVCCLAFFILRYQRKTKLIKNLSLSALEMIEMLFGAYIIVAIYNVISGGGLPSVREYIYPIMSADYQVVDVLQLRLDIPVSLFYVYFAAFTSTICFCGIKILLRKASNKHLFAFLCASIGLGVFTYYFNRVCYTNLQIATPMFAIIMALIVDNCFSYGEKDRNKIVFGKIALLFLVILSMESVFNLGFIVSKVKDTAYSTDEFYRLIDQANNLPEGTDFIGIGSSVFCMCVGCDNMVYTMDWEDMHPAGREYCYNEILNNDEIKYLVFEEGRFEEIKEVFPNAVIVDEFRYSDKNGSNWEWDMAELGK